MRKAAVFVIKGYQTFISPFLGTQCRFSPSCSQYAKEAFEKYGLIKGFALSAGRIARCHPWHAGGHDPLP